MMTLLYLTTRAPITGGFSVVNRRFSLSFNALQIHSYLVRKSTSSSDGGGRTNNPFHTIESRKVLSTPSRNYSSISNDETTSPNSQSKTSLPETHPYLSEIKPALSAIRKACRITTYLQPTTIDTNISGVNKKDASPVTIGDFAVQALVLNLLEKELDGGTKNIFIAEESSANLITEGNDNDDDNDRNGERIDLSYEILNVMKTCGFDDIIETVDDLKRSIDLGQTYNEDGTIMESVLKAKNIQDTEAFRTWCLDPIDGTRGFLRGKREGGQYCVALALIEVSLLFEQNMLLFLLFLDIQLYKFTQSFDFCRKQCKDGNPVVGILGCPNLPTSSTDTNYAWSEDETPSNNKSSRGCIIVASKGGGCYQFPLNPPDNDNDDSTSNYQRVHVTQNDGQGAIPLSQARFCIGVEKYSDADGKTSSIAKAFHNGELDENGDIKYAARMDSQVKYGVLSRGGAEIYTRLPKKTYVEWIWDHAPGRIVIEEAGGVQTDSNGDVIYYGFGAKMDENVDGVIASPGGVFHSKLVKTLQAISKNNEK